MSLKVFFLSWGMLILGVLMNGLGVFIVKLKMNTLGPMDLSSFGACFGYFVSLVKMPSALVGMIAVLVAPVPQAVAFSRMEFSVAYPASSAVSFLVLIPLSLFFLGESLTWNKMIGIGLIVVSAYLLYK